MLPFPNISFLTDPANGVKMKIWTCYEGLAAQQWYWTDDNRIALTGKGAFSNPTLARLNWFSTTLYLGLCLDLTDGKFDNGNPVQIWKCTDGNQNQIWI